MAYHHASTQFTDQTICMNMPFHLNECAILVHGNIIEVVVVVLVVVLVVDRTSYIPTHLFKLNTSHLPNDMSTLIFPLKYYFLRPLPVTHHYSVMFVFMDIRPEYICMSMVQGIQINHNINYAIDKIRLKSNQSLSEVYL